MGLFVYGVYLTISGDYTFWQGFFTLLAFGLVDLCICAVIQDFWEGLKNGGNK